MRSCLVCDDHLLMREALCGQMRLAWPEADVVAARDFDEARALSKERQPELILCDLAMPGAAPLEGVTALREAAPDSRIMVVTGSEDDALLLKLFEAGVKGFVSKNVSGELLEAAIRLVLADGRYLPPRLYELAAGSATPIVPSDGAPKFSGRKLEVLRAMARGLSNKEIALALDLSPATVKTHAAAIIAALGARNRTEATGRARDFGMI